MSETKRKWEVVEDGYHKEVRLVDCSTGQILGGVRGEKYSSRAEWDAHLRGTDKPQIGSYVTEDQAKAAVELALKKATMTRNSAEGRG